MPLTREKKTKIVEELAGRFKKQKIAIFTDFLGVNVTKLTTLRREMKKAGAEFKVAKKTFLRIALKAIGIEYDPKTLEGEIGVIFGYEDQIGPVKTAAKFSKENTTFTVLKGILDGKFLEGREVLTLAKLPGREQLLAQLAWVLNSPIQGFHTVLHGNLRNLVVVLNKIKEKK